MAALETGNEGRHVIRRVKAAREKVIDRLKECMDEFKGQISCELEYFSVVTLDRVLLFPDWSVSLRARETLKKRQLGGARGLR